MSNNNEVDQGPDPEALAQMKERGGTWAAYRNADMGHSQCGHLQFLRFGVGCTHEVPPATMPDTAWMGLGWRYRYEGKVNLETGEIER